MATTHIIGGYQVSDSVLGAVREASRRTGADFDYMLAKAAQESGFQADAEAATSSATGLYQFIETTWLQMVREHGARHGLAGMARQIENGPDGQPEVADPAARQRILDLRHDARLNAVMAGELANANKAHLQREVGGEIGSTELYLAHFLGAEGASVFLNAQRTDPDQPAADLFPAAARANRSVFFDPATGAARSLDAVHASFAGRFEDAMDVSSEAPARHRSSAPGSIQPGSNPAPTYGIPAGGREPISLWNLLYLNALPLPGK